MTVTRMAPGRVQVVQSSVLNPVGRHAKQVEGVSLAGDPKLLASQLTYSTMCQAKLQLLCDGMSHHTDL